MCVHIWENHNVFDQNPEYLDQIGLSSLFCYPETKVVKDKQTGDCLRIVSAVSTNINWRETLYRNWLWYSQRHRFDSTHPVKGISVIKDWLLLKMFISPILRLQFSATCHHEIYVVYLSERNLWFCCSGAGLWLTLRTRSGVARGQFSFLVQTLLLPTFPPSDLTYEPNAMASFREIYLWLCSFHFR